MMTNESIKLTLDWQIYGMYMFTIENIRIAHMTAPDHLKLNASPTTKI